MSVQFVAQSSMTNWQVAPAGIEIDNYDEPKVKYRQHVEEFISNIPRKSLRKKTFVTMCANVLCADIATSKDSIDPMDRDIYLPLEIALTKWSVSDHAKPVEERSLTTKLWFLNPGPPPPGCRNHALDHKQRHKIEYGQLDSSQDDFLSTDLEKVVKEINSFLTPDRTVFSLSLKHCRQDLGCLKWLNRQTSSKMKPIDVYSLEDLYVVLIRSLTDVDQLKLSICQGLAKHRMEFTSDFLDLEVQCDFHRNQVKEDDSLICDCCARALAHTYTTALLDDIKLFSQVNDPSIDLSPNEPKPLFT